MDNDNLFYGVILMSMARVLTKDPNRKKAKECLRKLILIKYRRHAKKTDVPDVKMRKCVNNLVIYPLPIKKAKFKANSSSNFTIF